MRVSCRANETPQPSGFARRRALGPWVNRAPAAPSSTASSFAARFEATDGLGGSYMFLPDQILRGRKGRSRRRRPSPTSGAGPEDPG